MSIVYRRTFCNLRCKEAKPFTVVHPVFNSDEAQKLIDKNFHSINNYKSVVENFIWIGQRHKQAISPIIDLTEQGKTIIRHPNCSKCFLRRFCMTCIAELNEKVACHTRINILVDDTQPVKEPTVVNESIKKLDPVVGIL